MNDSISKEWLIQKYVNEDISATTIALMSGTSFQSIYELLKEYGISTKKKQYNFTKEYLLDNYIEKHKSSYVIAKENGCSPSTIKNWLAKYNIKCRDGKGVNNGMFGRKWSIEHKNYLSEINSGERNSFYGKKHSINTIKKLSELSFLRYKDKTQHPRYIDGKSKFPYNLSFTKELKMKIRKIYKYTCQKCSLTEHFHRKKYGKNLHVHHIDYNKENSSIYNLIPLCTVCNTIVNKNRRLWKFYFNNIVKLRGA